MPKNEAPRRQRNSNLVWVGNQIPSSQSFADALTRRFLLRLGHPSVTVESSITLRRMKKLYFLVPITIFIFHLNKLNKSNTFCKGRRAIVKNHIIILNLLAARFLA
jgi:hypothetical protein